MTDKLSTKHEPVGELLGEEQGEAELSAVLDDYVGACKELLQTAEGMLGGDSIVDSIINLATSREIYLLIASTAYARFMRARGFVQLVGNSLLFRWFCKACKRVEPEVLVSISERQLDFKAGSRVDIFSCKK